MLEESPQQSNGTSSQFAVEQPSRGADRNRNALAEGVDRASEDILLPSLENGITLLDIEGDRGVAILQSLAVDHLLVNDGPAFWVDANGYATTTSLGRLAPSRRLLDRIHVARGFTPYQHYGALCDLPVAVNRYVREETAESTTSRRSSTHSDQQGGVHMPSLIVAPALDARYRSADALGAEQARTLQARALARLTAYAEGYDVPVLVTRTAPDEFTEPIETAATHHLRCEQTRMGPRFVGEEFETLVYPVEGGSYYQTTFAYWREILETRASQLGLQPASPEPVADEDGIGHGTMADGTSTSLTADPMLDAWTAVSGTRG